MKRKICVVTGTRAEYGLLYWLMREIQHDEELELQLIVTGMHLSLEFGLTYQEIEKEFKIHKKIEILLSSDTPIAVSKSMGLAQISFAEAYDELNPNIVVLLGDRFEIFAAASAATVMSIPIAHLHGGESTQGAIDEAFRHCITKMSQLHFTATEEYRKRVIQLGEIPQRVFNTGGLGIDNIFKLNLLSKSDFENAIGFTLKQKNVLVTFHPVTLEPSHVRSQFQSLLDTLDEFQDMGIIFTKANADSGGRAINEMIENYAQEHPKNTIVFSSMGQLRYLSALQYMDAVVGNSSSGLIEAPSFKIATINIGDRQKGRIKAESVIDCPPAKESIREALSTVFSEEFKKILANVKNPYGEPGASLKIKNILKTIELQNILLKEFNDIRFNLN